MNDYSATIAAALAVRPQQVAATVALLDSGNTLPFIARYRKEQTGGLDEEQLRQLVEQLGSLRTLDERRATILQAIGEQGKLTPELEAQIAAATSRTALEDLYAPFKLKRRTRASVARDKGLAPLAALIAQQPQGGRSAEELAQPFVGEQVPSAEEALAGARDIVAEQVSEHPAVRGLLRERALRWATVRSEKLDAADDPKGVYRAYYAWSSATGRVRPHQTLAINRGEAAKILRVAVEVPERDWREAVASTFRPRYGSPLAEQLRLAIDEGAERLLLPAIERDVRRTLGEQAEQHAIATFAQNLRGLLSQPPLAGQTVLGIDPGFRSGCKLAITDPTGRLLATGTIFPHSGQRGRDEALRELEHLVTHHAVTLIAIGNGTASRETETLVAELIGRVPQLSYLLVSEAGASVYSASPLARAELPELDVSIRGAVSIARRVQDPLAELVKIDPQSIGVGLYQHDVEGPRLAESLGAVVESVVNQVGVDANTASPALLTHVAGIGPKLAAKIVAHRDTSGPFASRMALRKVPSLGPKAFEQAAGFLRVRGGNPFDASAIHPESYAVAEAVLRLANATMTQPTAERRAAIESLVASQPLEQLAAAVGTGVPTLRDILEQLVRPGRDPREDLPPPVLRRDVLSLDDLAVGLRLKGTVRNVVDFGAFVDIGVKDDGLLHRTQIPQGTVLGVGDVIEVEIREVEAQRGRISLGWPSAEA